MNKVIHTPKARCNIHVYIPLCHIHIQGDSLKPNLCRTIYEQSEAPPIIVRGTASPLSHADVVYIGQACDTMARSVSGRKL